MRLSGTRDNRVAGGSWRSDMDAKPAWAISPPGSAFTAAPTAVNMSMEMAATNDLVETPFPASDVITMRCIERPTCFVALKIEFRFLSQGLEGTRSTHAMSLCETELASPSSQEMVTSLQDVPVTEPRSVIAAPQQTRSSGLRSLDWSPVIGLALSYWL
jgi:hypothetical protein